MLAGARYSHRYDVVCEKRRTCHYLRPFNRITTVSLKRNLMKERR